MPSNRQNACKIDLCFVQQVGKGLERVVRQGLSRLRFITARPSTDYYIERIPNFEHNDSAGLCVILLKNVIVCDSAFEEQTSLFRDCVPTYVIV